MNSRPRTPSPIVAPQHPTLAEMEGLTAAQAYGIADYGWTLLEQGRPDAAAVVFETLTLSNPLHAYFHTLLGYALERCGNVDRALEAFERALEADPDETGALVHRAELLMRCKRLDQVDEIARLLERALEVDPECRRPETRRARVLVDVIAASE